MEGKGSNIRTCKDKTPFRQRRLYKYSLLKSGKVIELKRHHNYGLMFDQQFAVARVMDLWKTQNEYYIEVKLFLKADTLETLTPSDQQYGEDEMVECKHHVIMTSHNFRMCYHDNSNITEDNPCLTYLPHQLLKVTISGKTFYRLKKPIHENDNCSLLIDLHKQGINAVSLSKIIHDGKDVRSNSFPDKPKIEILEYSTYCKIRKIMQCLDYGGFVDYEQANYVTSRTPLRYLFSRFIVDCKDWLTQYCDKGKLVQLLRDANNKRRANYMDDDEKQDIIDDEIYAHFLTDDVTYYDEKIAYVSRRKRRKKQNLLTVFK